MQKLIRFFVVALFLSGFATALQAQQPVSKYKEAGFEVDKRIDNMRYWRKMIEYGLIEADLYKNIPAAVFTGSTIKSKLVITEDSPDVPVTNLPSTQSENSIIVDPTNVQSALNSNNSTSQNASILYGANDLYTTDGGETWEGELEGAGGPNSGDPAVGINNDGTYFVEYIHSNGGQGISYSTDQGANWTPVLVADAPSGFGGLLDKNHFWIDNSTSSTYEGNMYVAWTNFGGSNDSEIEICRSTDDGLTWSAPVNISGAINAGSHNQGVNISTGMNGEVYVVWAVYDSWPSDESCLAFARSLDGGATWEPAQRILDDIRGIRTTEVSKDMRVNSFPSMTVDLAQTGNIYVVWANIGTPGINTGDDVDIYMIKSEDNGLTWSTPMKVNQDVAGLGKEHYMPWIACDPIYGYLAVIYYDDRNVTSTQCETYVSVSTDNGETWEDLKISDVAFTPSPIPGLAGGYMGDYLGISVRDRMVYPVWPDNRSGNIMTYTSPFELGPPPNQPWIVYNSNLVNDFIGNQNGVAEYGENIKLSVGLKNIGDQPASDVTVTVSTESPYVTFTDNSEFYGEFTVGSTVSMEDAFSFVLSNDVPNNHKVVFNLLSSNGTSTWEGKFNITAYAPELNVVDILLANETINQNGYLEPGETADIQIETSNMGGADAVNVITQLLSGNEFITINTPATIVELMEASSVETVTFNITVASDAPQGQYVAFIYNAQVVTQVVEQPFLLPIGEISAMEDFETGDLTLFDWQVGDNVWAVVTGEVYEGTYAAQTEDIDDDGIATLMLQINLLNDGEISYYRKVSSEDTYDFFRFYIDDEMQEELSGEIDWELATFPISAGEHSLKWEYEKDFTVSSGGDCAWIDFINFPPIISPTAPFAAEATSSKNVSCGEQAIQLYAFASGGSGDYTYSWTPTTGLDNANIATPIATITENIEYSVVVSDGSTEITAVVPITYAEVEEVEITGSSYVNPGEEKELTANAGFISYLWNTGENTAAITVSGDVISLPYCMFYVTAIDQNNCFSYDEHQVSLWLTSIDENINNKLNAQISPNPSNGTFILNITNAQKENVLMEVLNAEGKVVFSEKIRNNSQEISKNFDLTNLSKGIYFVRLTAGSSNTVQKLIIQ